MTTPKQKLLAIIQDFKEQAETAQVGFDNRPHLGFVNSDLAFEIVSEIPGVGIRRCMYSNGNYIPVAEISTEHYKIEAAGSIVVKNEIW